MTQKEIQTAVVVGLVAVLLTWWAATSDYSPVKHAPCTATAGKARQDGPMGDDVC